MRSPRGPKRPHRRRRSLLWTALGIGLIGVTTFIDPLPRLVWNASASAPRGLYLRLSRDFVRGDLGLARLPGEARRLAVARGYLAPDALLIKRVAASRFETVCMTGNDLYINGRHAARRLEQDGKGRPMPRWQGCERLGGYHVLLLAEGEPTSFDGRYFGPVERRLVIGRLVPLWIF
ncbi:S26 family signal peptidase [Parvibaculum sp.]|uniref:S26 family signal peptidase n=1 Tax=Parvibaculum sp. TaxID=2024848 RepID=UPI002C7F573F|nr:S26 family signal peptidase [Parvibaculum sp.]HUD53087.1 S26 family signal peptidase [Parvibaculum sp.]